MPVKDGIDDFNIISAFGIPLPLKAVRHVFPIGLHA